MENLKIEAKNLDQKNEIINLFILLGYKEDSAYTYNNDDLMGIHAYADGDIQDVLDEDYNDDDHKEITLPELRALVSLHKKPINIVNVLNEVRSDALGLLKDKEYLRRNAGGTYSYVGTVHPDHVHDLLIEIPEGAELYVDLGGVSGFYKNNFKQVWDQGNWEDTVYNSENLKIWNKAPVLWQRHTQPEELPFVDDKPSLNDQYAEIEQVRKEYKLKNDMSVDDYINSLRCTDAESSKHNHYFIDVSDVDEIDFYEIALRYNVTDPCIQHILKKCLAVGNRGHKDFHTDLKDIYDTAARALHIHGG